MARTKRIKIAAYESYDNCFNRQSDWKGRWHEYFQNDHPITLELGCGRAELLYALAKKYPERNFVGVDLKPSRMWAAAKDAIEEGLKNVAFIHINLLELTDHFAENEADQIWVTFPDPFPKKRQAKHRLINPDFLAVYHSVLHPNGILHYKTDNIDLFKYSLEVFVREGNIRFHELSFNLHEEERIHEDCKFKTTYEKRFMEMDVPINYVSFSFLDPK